MDGTITELTSVLKGLNREDAINVIAEIRKPMKKGRIFVKGIIYLNFLPGFSARS